METDSHNALEIVSTIPQTEVLTDRTQILQRLNFSLQIKNRNLETENVQLKRKVEELKNRNVMFENLSEDLAFYRTQTREAAITLLQKTQHIQKLKEEINTLKMKCRTPSPTSAALPPALSTITSPSPLFNVRRKLQVYEDITAEQASALRKSSAGRPSMGSCNNISSQIASEEALPVHLRAAYKSVGSLRNSVLLRCQALKSASTESLESTGRKSMRAQENKLLAPAPREPETRKTINKSSLSLLRDLEEQNKTASRAQPSKSNISSNKVGPSKLNTSGGVRKVPAAVRPALADTNGPKRFAKVNPASVKRSNSQCSTKSAIALPKQLFRK